MLPVILGGIVFHNISSSVAVAAGSSISCMVMCTLSEFLLKVELLSYVYSPPDDSASAGDSRR